MTKAEAYRWPSQTWSQIHGSNRRKFLVACSTVPPFEGNGCSRRSQSFHFIVPLVLQDAIFKLDLVTATVLPTHESFLEHGMDKAHKQTITKVSTFQGEITTGGGTPKGCFFWTACSGLGDPQLSVQNVGAGPCMLSRRPIILVSKIMATR